MEADISVVIPCYNSGEFLMSAVESVEQYKGIYQYEIVIVDDGSTDENTMEVLSKLERKNYKVIYQSNKGPAAARNTGIRNSHASYILFLDSDNKIRPRYIDTGIEILKTKPEVGVVYGNASFFGKENRLKITAQAFDIEHLLAENYIDMCSVIRKTVWDDVGGLDEKRILIGHEDWDFWLSVYEKGWQFYYASEVLFDYRIRDHSLITQETKNSYDVKTQYIYIKHIELVVKQMRQLYTTQIIYNEDRKRPFRSFLKYTYNQYRKFRKL